MTHNGNIWPDNCLILGCVCLCYMNCFSSMASLSCSYSLFWQPLQSCLPPWWLHWTQWRSRIRQQFGAVVAKWDSWLPRAFPVTFHLYSRQCTVCLPIKAKFRSRAFTYDNIRVLTSSYYYSFVWRFQKCMNCSCSSKDTKVIRFLIFRKIGFLNFAILKSSSNSEMDVLIKKFLN